jgi:phosphoribosyl-AMP cyclohydrolase
VGGTAGMAQPIPPVLEWDSYSSVWEDCNVPDVEQLIDFDKLGGVVPVIAQDDTTGEVLMMAYMNREAFVETLRTGRVCYFSRSRNRLWRKGEESGNVQEVRGVYVDCDADTVLIKVHQIGGAACHEGYPSCFFRRLTDDALEIVAQRVFDPNEVYSKKS